MSRPKPSIILEITDKKIFKSEQVLDADGIWAVFYKGRPVNLKTISLVASSFGPKYKKVSFSNPGHALNLSKKLNKMYNCQDFRVYELSKGNPVD